MKPNGRQWTWIRPPNPPWNHFKKHELMELLERPPQFTDFYSENLWVDLKHAACVCVCARPPKNIPELQLKWGVGELSTSGIERRWAATKHVCKLVISATEGFNKDRLSGGCPDFCIHHTIWSLIYLFFLYLMCGNGNKKEQFKEGLAFKCLFSAGGGFVPFYFSTKTKSCFVEFELKSSKSFCNKICIL